MVKVIVSVRSPTEIICPKSVLKLKFHLEIELVKAIELKQTLVSNWKLFEQLPQRSMGKMAMGNKVGKNKNLIIVLICNKKITN